MFELAVMPLTMIWQHQAEGDASQNASKIFLIELQAELTRLAGHDVGWSEDDVDFDQFEEPVLLDPFCLFALRSVAAHFERRDEITSFEMSETPWDHEIFDEIEAQDGSKRFPQLLHTDAELTAFVPSELDEVYLLSSGDEDDDDEFAVASLPRLQAELAVLGEALEMEQHRGSLDAMLSGELDPTDGPTEVTVEIDLENPEESLLPARFAWLMLSNHIEQAVERGLPMLVFFNDFEEDIADDEEIVEVEPGARN